MPSMRRVRIFGSIVFCVVLYTLYLTSKARETRTPDLYSKTKDALGREKGTYHPHSPPKSNGKVDEDEALTVAMSGRLKEAEQVAKDNANAKAPNPPEGFKPLEEKARPVVEDLEPGKPTEDRNVAGRKKHGIENPTEKLMESKDDTTEDREVKGEMNSIFKKAPIIIFSKSYCPHSKRAKDILLEKYTIVPAPYVVELDQHPKGALLQAKLADMTGRRTVPNVMIGGKSIGGGDDVAELDQAGKLIEKIKTLAGKQMQTVKEKHL